MSAQWVRDPKISARGLWLRLERSLNLGLRGECCNRKR